MWTSIFFALNHKKCHDEKWWWWWWWWEGRKSSERLNFHLTIKFRYLQFFSWIDAVEHQDATSMHLIWIFNYHEKCIIWRFSSYQKNGPQHNRRTLLIPLYLFFYFYDFYVSPQHRLCIYFILYCYYFFGYDIIPSQYECTHILWIMEEYHNPPTRSILNFIFIKQQVPVLLFLTLSLSRMLFNI